MISWTIRFQLILLQFGDSNETVIIVLASLKAFKISNVHDAHSIVFRSEVKSGNVADNTVHCQKIICKNILLLLSSYMSLKSILK